MAYGLFDSNDSNILNSMNRFIGLNAGAEPTPLTSMSELNPLAGLSRMVTPFQDAAPLPSLAKDGIQAEASQQVKDLQDLVGETAKAVSPLTQEPSKQQSVLTALAHAVAIGFSKDPAQALQEQLKAQQDMIQQRQALLAKANLHVLEARKDVAVTKMRVEQDLRHELAGTQKEIMETKKAMMMKDADFKRQVTLEMMKQDHATQLQLGNQQFQAAMEEVKAGDKRLADRYANVFTLVDKTDIPPTKALGIVARVMSGKATAEDDQVMRDAQNEKFARSLLLSGRELTQKEKEKNTLDFAMKAYLSQEQVPIFDAKGQPIIDPLSNRPATRPKTAQEKWLSASAAASVSGAYYKLDVSTLQNKIKENMDEADHTDSLAKAKITVDQAWGKIDPATIIQHINESTVLSPTVKSAALEYLKTKLKNK